MTRDEVGAKVLALLSEKQNVEAPTEGQTFEQLGMDSLDRLEMTIFLEDAFGYELPDAETEKWMTVKDAIDWIAGKEAT